jgi:hypothetical protein
MSFPVFLLGPALTYYVLTTHIATSTISHNTLASHYFRKTAHNRRKQSHVTRSVMSHDHDTQILPYETKRESDASRETCVLILRRYVRHSGRLQRRNNSQLKASQCWGMHVEIIQVVVSVLCFYSPSWLPFYSCLAEQAARLALIRCRALAVRH